MFQNHDDVKEDNEEEDSKAIHKDDECSEEVKDNETDNDEAEEISEIYINWGNHGGGLGQEEAVRDQDCMWLLENSRWSKISMFASKREMSVFVTSSFFCSCGWGFVEEGI